MDTFNFDIFVLFHYIKIFRYVFYGSFLIILENSGQTIITLEGVLGTCAECSDYPMPATKILIFVSTKDEILEIADHIIPGKNPKVYQNYLMTDELTQRERVRLGREFSKSPRLKQYGKGVTSF